MMRQSQNILPKVALDHEHGSQGYHQLVGMVLEVSAPKAGNVHRHAAFDDVNWQDFVISAIVTSPILAQAGTLGVGQCVFQAVELTQTAVGSNTNLGMLLLLAPLSAAVDGRPTQQVLDALDDQDARWIYQAIALARPGGLGKVERGDVHEMVQEQDKEPGVKPGPHQGPGVVEAMGLAAGRDVVARQYVNDFADVRHLADVLVEAAGRLTLDQAIVWAHLHQMAREPDTLIARKLGAEVAGQAAVRARGVLEAQWPDGQGAASVFLELDQWLRDPAHRRNPGSSADLVAAAIYLALRDHRISLPQRWLEDLWA